ncbi:dUTP diphosphatase [Ammoniphilus sp. 3BR4]|uniref:dUTP diphosphatase n=1 Tax=Ammoniphilus sp. 3BR4 TaxID=3158265 RepID=UPI0034650C35
MQESTVTIQIMKLPGNEDISLPTQMSQYAAGFDLFAAIKEPIELLPGKRVLVPAGFSLALPMNMEAQIRPRSGLALKSGITCLNSPGTIDADYRGEVGVILINHGEAPFLISRGDRIAQMVIQALPAVKWEIVKELPPTDRGEGGFGHTGIN